MLTPSIAATALASAFALIRLGGGPLQVSRRRSSLATPQPIQPARGGVSRRSFWTPAHAAFELALIAALVVTWSQPEIRIWLLIGLANHATMRIWSAFDFIPRALAFERADPATIAESTARNWTRRSLWRLPLDVVPCVTTLAAFAEAARLRWGD